MKKRNAVYSIRIFEEEKELLEKNPALKKELDDYVRSFLRAFSTKE